MSLPKPDVELLDQLILDSHARDLFELIPDVHFFIKDHRGRLTYCNTAHRHGLFRYHDAGDLYGKENFDFFPTPLAAAFAEDDRQVIRSGKPLIDRIELNVTAGGALNWFCTTKVPARNSAGKIVGLLGISRRLAKADQRLAEFNQLLAAVDFIHENRTAPLQIPALAKKCKLTEATFRREFKRLFRITPMKFIIRLRLHEACTRLANSTQSIGEVAHVCGFEDQNYFARQFKIHMQMTPSEFRARQRVN